jgi:hypothetical protein
MMLLLLKNASNARSQPMCARHLLHGEWRADCLMIRSQGIAPVATRRARQHFAFRAKTPVEARTHECSETTYRD